MDPLLRKNCPRSLSLYEIQCRFEFLELELKSRVGQRDPLDRPGPFVVPISACDYVTPPRDLLVRVGLCDFHSWNRLFVYSVIIVIIIYQRDQIHNLHTMVLFLTLPLSVNSELLREY